MAKRQGSRHRGKLGVTVPQPRLFRISKMTVDKRLKRLLAELEEVRIQAQTVLKNDVRVRDHGWAYKTQDRVGMAILAIMTLFPERATEAPQEVTDALKFQG